MNRRAAVAALVVGAGLAVGVAPTASADITTASICIGLSRQPDAAQVSYQAGVLMAYGYTAYQAGWMIGYAIQSDCPQYWGAAQEYIDMQNGGFLV